MAAPNRTREDWIRDHPYLKPIAGFDRALEEAVRAISPPPVALPAWDAYAEEYADGIPLLGRKTGGPAFVSEAAEALGDLLKQLDDAALPEPLASEFRALGTALKDVPAECERAIQGIVSEGDERRSGLLRALGWNAINRVLEPVYQGFLAWRDEDRWNRGYCPICGAPPVVARLVPREAGRDRWLSCGLCRTPWRYRRIGCPFCGSEDQARLDVIEIEGEGEYRIDACQACKGYVKTYLGQGEQSFFLADWPTLHLDLLAASAGWRRRGASLYDL